MRFMESKELSSRQLRLRLAGSLVVGIAATVIGISAFLHIRGSETLDEAPGLLRQGLLLNEKIWSAFFSPHRLSHLMPSPPVGKQPRVNGLLGLKQAPVDPRKFRVQVQSAERSLQISIPELKLLPQTGTSTEFKCIEGWSEVFSYSGVRFSDFLKSYRLGTKTDGSMYRYVGLETPDGEYYVSIDMDSMLHPQTILAFEMNSSPLSEKNGAPLRLIIPIKYGIKSLKRIGRIFFSDERPPDYWAELGYDWYAGL